MLGTGILDRHWLLHRPGRLLYASTGIAEASGCSVLDSERGRGRGAAALKDVRYYLSPDLYQEHHIQLMDSVVGTKRTSEMDHDIEGAVPSNNGKVLRRRSIQVRPPLSCRAWLCPLYPRFLRHFRVQACVCVSFCVSVCECVSVRVCVA